MITLLDTGPIVAMLDRDDLHRSRCCEATHEADGSMQTCEAIIAEACYLLRRVLGAVPDLLMNVHRGRFRVEYQMQRRVEPLARLIKKYADVPMDLADACLVDMATVLGTSRMLTLDAEFAIYRWGKNRPFDLLIDV
ncbi:MAG: pilus assembly protein [Pirellulales bacterium]|nr:pilus assembly protein [Pirellulales bacterium]